MWYVSAQFWFKGVVPKSLNNTADDSGAGERNDFGRGGGGSDLGSKRSASTEESRALIERYILLTTLNKKN